ncbi:uncharacterized protein LOC133910521 [Phragmites australis]|uniref:uncharacterized protein LOC133910521 n=1 Tax=Phragmites australis TaxID=29695 RepID=UPI002D77A0D5|nr:uncharacterized protein LOC133910521 [Phragmites australis]
MGHLSSKHVLLAAAILCMAIPSCKAQDAVQIVARAALCFDNHTVINNCLQQMGISTNPGGRAAHGGSASGVLTDKIPTSPNANAVLCNTPCFGHMMLMTDCMDGILSNFQGYSSGLMQGVRAIFQMSCGGSSNGTAGGADAPPAAAHGHGETGVVKGSAASGKAARNVSRGAAAFPANGAAGGLHVGDLLWVAILVAVQYVLIGVVN